MSETAPNGSALIAVARFKFFVANTLGVLKRTAADGCAEDVTCPVSAFSAVQATALGAASAYEFIFAFGTASTGRLCRQVRVLLAKEPFKVRKPARLERRNPTARSSRLLSLAGSNRIGGDGRGTTPSITRGSRPRNRGRRREDTRARAVQRVRTGRRSLLLLRGSSFSLRVSPVVACFAAEETSLFLRHLWTFCLNPPLVLERLNWPNSHHGASAPMIISRLPWFVLPLSILNQSYQERDHNEHQPYVEADVE
jgi:hypothetical protein